MLKILPGRCLFLAIGPSSSLVQWKCSLESTIQHQWVLLYHVTTLHTLIDTPPLKTITNTGILEQLIVKFQEITQFFARFEHFIIKDLCDRYTEKWHWCMVIDFVWLFNAMFGTRRLAKRSIVGTQVCVPWIEDGRYYPGKITSTSEWANGQEVYNVYFPKQKVTKTFQVRISLTFCVITS